TSDDNITFMERATPNVFFPDRQVGVMAMSNELDKRLLWQVATFREANGSGNAFSPFKSTDWDVAARLTGLPIWADEGSHVLHLGIDYIHRFIGSDSLTYQQRPEAHLADNFVVTKTITPAGQALNMTATDANVFDVELAYVQGPFSFQSEYTNSLV